MGIASLPPVTSQNDDIEKWASAKKCVDDFLHFYSLFIAPLLPKIAFRLFCILLASCRGL